MSTGANNSKEDVLCSFCSEKSSPSQIGEHLMICGNKTDQCPNCRKYIRRAIFAYHYENNCANLDEIDTDVRTNANPPNSATRSQSADPPPPSTPLTTPNRKQLIIHPVDLTSHPNLQTGASQQSHSDFCESTHVTMRCPYCYYECTLGERDMHMENCLRNPAALTKRQQPPNNPISSQNSGRPIYINVQNNTANIPCEFCGRLIKENDYQDHMYICEREHDPNMQQRLQEIDREFVRAGDRCRYCNKQYMMSTLTQHETFCKKNPANIILERQHADTFSLLPLRSPYTTWPQ